LQTKDYEKAETAYKKAIELKPDYGEAYSGLSNIYNAQRKFDLAADAAAKATQYGGGGAGAAGGGGGGNADTLYNQGVILWNAGKIPEAKKQFEAAIQANANHAESHYQLGMALVNEGNTAGAATEFGTYLKLAPTGPNAATAKALMDQLKK
jgi:tetratricopeptide (TPR) repeat protein